MRARRRTATLVVLLLVGLDGCKRRSTTPEQVPFKVVHQHPWSSGLERPFRWPITDDESWTEFWTLLHGSRSPFPPLPRIDFGKEMVIAVGLGYRGSTGYAVAVTDVQAVQTTSGQRQLHVTYRETTPGCWCAVGCAITQPYSVVKLGRHDAAIQFVHVTRQGKPCGRPFDDAECPSKDGSSPPQSPLKWSTGPPDRPVRVHAR